MFNINNKKIISLAIGTLAIAIFTFISVPNSAKADNCKIWWEGNNYKGFCPGDSVNLNNNYNTYDNSYNNGYNNVTNPIPSISSINPSSATVNTNTVITVNGYNFVQGSTIKWNGNDRQTTFISSTTLQAQIYSTDIYSRGDYVITVSNPAPGGGISNAVMFTAKDNTVYVTSNTSKNQNTTVNSYTNKTTTTANNTSSSQKSANDTATSDLAANVIFGSNAFLPSSIFQWILFFILILLAIVLWRKLYVSDEERHHSTLKHS